MAIKDCTVVLPDIKAFPWTESKEEGEVVPTPTLPFWSTLNRLPSVPTKRVEVAMREFTVEVPEVRELP